MEPFQRNHITRYILIGCGALFLNLMYGLVCVLMGIAFAGIQAVSLNAFLKAGEERPPKQNSE